MNLGGSSQTKMGNVFEVSEDVALVNVWREVVVDVEKSIEGCNECSAIPAELM